MFGNKFSRGFFFLIFFLRVKRHFKNEAVGLDGNGA
jgi:hypothetical protein